MKSILIAIVTLAAPLPGWAIGESTNTAPELSETSTNLWSFSASAYGYLVPDSRDYINPNFTADHGWLHLEARYNYEALETGSLWVGYNFSTGETLTFEIAPMLGGVFGELTGVAPGYSLALGYKRFALSSQGEYFFQTGDSSGNFFYTWSELTYSPLDWFRVGLAVQRTKLYQTDLDIQRGLMVGFTYKQVDLAAYVFNFGWTEPTVVLAVALNF
jgi:hypothetical protein